MKDILRHLREHLNDLSKRQKQIAVYILEHYEKAAYLTATQLAKEVGTSESTVVRFAAELGFDGYQKLQKHLQEVARTQLTSLQRMELASERIKEEDVLSSVLKSDAAKIYRTLEQIDRSQFDGAVKSLISAKHIYITGVRSAAALASFTGFYFNLLFDNVRLINTTGADDIFEQLLRVGEGDAVLGMSFPRYSKNTIKALEYARKQGAKIIGITDNLQSPIVPLSDYCLTASSDTDSFVDSLVAPLSVINALIHSVGMKKKQEAKKTFEVLETIWDEYEVYEKE
ncbi:MAG: MurR/RpiR family transcriptional regulator [Ruminococcaceae bacterium]|nr:MurR/RpiR family transcriptional regulator [Oscillospiraceae bacterium]